MASKFKIIKNVLKPSRNPLKVKNSIFKTGLSAKAPGFITPAGQIKPQKLELAIADMKIKADPDEVIKEKFWKKMK